MTRSKIRTSGAEGLTLSSTALTVADGLTLSDGDVTLASGHGVSFAATSDGTTMTGELLDDYEEGTFVPNAEFTTTNPTSGSVTTGNGLYTKIGRLVTIHMRLLNINDSGASGDLKITGLPFTSLVDSGDGAVATYGGTVSHAFCNTAASTYLTSEILDNKAEARIIENIDNTNRDPVNTGNITDDTTDFFITVTYPTAS